jgi:hypothetical protein
LLFRETREVVSLISLFHEMACFGETCFAKQRKASSFLETVRKNIPRRGERAVEETEDCRGGRGP